MAKSTKGSSSSSSDTNDTQPQTRRVDPLGPTDNPPPDTITTTPKGDE